MDKYMMIALMLLEGRISLQRAEWLSVCHYDIVEDEWLHTADLEGTFTGGEL